MAGGTVDPSVLGTVGRILAEVGLVDPVDIATCLGVAVGTVEGIGIAHIGQVHLTVHLPRGVASRGVAKGRLEGRYGDGCVVELTLSVAGAVPACRTAGAVGMVEDIGEGRVFIKGIYESICTILVADETIGDIIAVRCDPEVPSGLGVV